MREFTRRHLVESDVLGTEYSFDQIVGPEAAYGANHTTNKFGNEIPELSGKLLFMQMTYLQECWNKLQ